MEGVCSKCHEPIGKPRSHALHGRGLCQRHRALERKRFSKARRRDPSGRVAARELARSVGWGTWFTAVEAVAPLVRHGRSVDFLDVLLDCGLEESVASDGRRVFRYPAGTVAASPPKASPPRPEGGAFPTLEEAKQLADVHWHSSRNADEVLARIGAGDLEGARASLKRALLDSRVGCRVGPARPWSGGKRPRGREKGPCALDDRELDALAMDAIHLALGKELRPYSVTLTMAESVEARSPKLREAARALSDWVEERGGLAVFAVDVSPHELEHLHGLVVGANHEDIEDRWRQLSGGMAKVTRLTNWERVVEGTHRVGEAVRQAKQVLRYAFEEKIDRAGLPLDLYTDVVGTKVPSERIAARRDLEAAILGADRTTEKRSAAS